MCKQQSRTQISFILCQLWIGAEEANSLESYKKKVSEIIKHPAAGLSAHSQPDRDREETSCHVSFWPSEHQRFNRSTSSLLPFLHCALCVRVDGSYSYEYLIFRNKSWLHHCSMSCRRANVTHGHWQGEHISLRNFIFAALFGISVFFFFKDARLNLE